MSTSNDGGLEVRLVLGWSSSGWLSGLGAVMKDAGNLNQVGDNGEQAHAAAAAGTGLDVVREGPPEQLRPRAVAGAHRDWKRRAARRGGAGRGSLVGRLARPRLGHHQGPPLGSGGQDFEVAHGVDPGRWHERDEAAEQRQRVEDDGDVTVTEGLLESDADEAIGPGRIRSVASGGRKMYVSMACRPC